MSFSLIWQGTKTASGAAVALGKFSDLRGLMLVLTGQLDAMLNARGKAMRELARIGGENARVGERKSWSGFGVRFGGVGVHLGRLLRLLRLARISCSSSFGAYPASFWAPPFFTPFLPFSLRAYVAIVSLTGGPLRESLVASAGSCSCRGHAATAASVHAAAPAAVALAVAATCAHCGLDPLFKELEGRLFSLRGRAAEKVGDVGTDDAIARWEAKALDSRQVRGRSLLGSDSTIFGSASS